MVVLPLNTAAVDDEEGGGLPKRGIMLLNTE